MTTGPTRYQVRITAVLGGCPLASGRGWVAGLRGHLGMGSAQARAPRVQVCVSRTRTHALKQLLQYAEASCSHTAKGS